MAVFEKKKEMVNQTGANELKYHIHFAFALIKAR